MNDDKQHGWNFWYFVAAIFGILLFQYFFAQTQLVEPVAYSEFLDQVRAGKVAEVTVTENRVRGVLHSPAGQEATRKEIIATRVDPELEADLAKHGVVVRGQIESTFLRDLLGWILPVLLFLGVWLFVFRRFASSGGFGAGSGLMSIGKSKAKIYVEKDTKVTFADVAGVDEAKEKLAELIAFLKDPGTYGRLGARAAKGVLLVGPPGTGKTLLARAVAGEAGVVFLSISGSEFVEMFVGVGAARVRDLFEQARKSAPCIIFIDELDALGAARGLGVPGGGQDEKAQTLNQLLAELDGFDPSEGVVLLAATNRPEILDPALLRAGRFDRQILVDRPDRTGRVDILRVHVRKIELAGDVALEDIAALTAGFTGADLANLVNEAAVLATRRNAPSVELGDFVAGIERIVAGLEKRNRLLNPHEREVVANHEMGHALIALSQPGTDKVQKVSIIPRGIGALGYTIQRPTEDRFLMTGEELASKMTVLLGGRAAETLVFEEISTGAADDLAKATDIARNMVARYGMGETLGQMTYDTDPAPMLGGPDSPARFWQQRTYSEATAREIDLAVRALVEAAFLRARDILARNRTLLDRCAAELLRKETLTEAELTALTAGRLQAPAPDGAQQGED
jgi:cell division protease FtsH